ncbi:acetolactate decarboxylase [Fodinisporobacter ferrooxydans]|uniref:Alpha-acetolactate decarboxylase n=1 Tax=Fodinisporobacter ferrooxydans TaxID=2901836 RepID=A0ABY4CKQ6_9BACL|nr:acetolactate decarboxylase [Alicyclobacillaceae bacterium MYW30-H2]
MKKQVNTILSAFAVASLTFAITGCGSTNSTSAANSQAAQGDTASANQLAPKDLLYQYSTINGLIVGVDDGDMTLGELRKYGSMGLGTINALDGEMIEMDGKFYQIDSAGKLHVLDDATKTPFAVVTNFSPTNTTTISNVKNFSDLAAKLQSHFTKKNDFYAVKITGTFNYVKARTVPKQQKPYPPLTVATSHQSEFEFKNVKGTLFGFYTPKFASGINVPGWHLHFITDDKTSGGHVLDLHFDSANAQFAELTQFQVSLPQNKDFQNVNLAGDTSKDITKAESNHK